MKTPAVLVVVLAAVALRSVDGLQCYIGVPGAQVKSQKCTAANMKAVMLSMMKNVNPVGPVRKRRQQPADYDCCITMTSAGSEPTYGCGLKANCDTIKNKAEEVNGKYTCDKQAVKTCICTGNDCNKPAGKPKKKLLGANPSAQSAGQSAKKPPPPNPNPTTTKASASAAKPTPAGAAKPAQTPKQGDKSTTGGEAAKEEAKSSTPASTAATKKDGGGDTSTKGGATTAAAAGPLLAGLLLLPILIPNNNN